jgi:hypothetical protein
MYSGQEILYQLPEKEWKRSDTGTAVFYSNMWAHNPEDMDDDMNRRIYMPMGIYIYIYISLSLWIST